MQLNMPFTKTIVRQTDRGTIRYKPPSIRRFASWITIALVLFMWQAITWFELISPTLVPAPIDVFEKFLLVLEDGRLWLHTSTTLIEVGVGLTAGVSIAFILGYAIAHSKFLEDLLSPIIVSLQSTPIVAYAPLLIIWFGSDIMSKIIICALIVFFPMLMNTVVGIRNVPSQLRDVMRVSQASWWQMFIKLEIPAALPVLLTGLKTSATLAVVGAVVGEFINARAGLGFWIRVAQNQYDTALVYVCVIMLAVIARLLFGAVGLLEKRLLRWQNYS